MNSGRRRAGYPASFAKTGSWVYTLLPIQRVYQKMIKNILTFVSIAVFALCMVFISLLFPACNTPDPNSPHITSLEATHPYVYTTGKTELTCNATAPNGGDLTYVWVCTNGTFKGIGNKVSWRPPNEYGEFHIMVTVTDSQGKQDSSSTTITVVYNENQTTGCPSCNRR